MAQHEIIKLFENLQIRTVWDDKDEKYFFSVIDIIKVLTGSENPRRYWSDLKRKLSAEGSQLYENIVQLKLSSSDGKKYLTDVADVEQVMRIIQSIPSKKAEPFKQWLAQTGAERLRQMQDPERSIEQMVRDYRRMGYSENWINQRIKTIEIRKGLTDEWKRGGVQEGREYARLTDLMSKIWSGMTTAEYKQYKGLTGENLRDNMTNMELLLNALAEQTATDISRERNPQGLAQNAYVAKDGAEVARNARADIEHRLGHSVISQQKAIDHIKPLDELPLGGNTPPEQHRTRQNNEEKTS